MKKFMGLLAVLAVSPAFASPSQVDLVKKNLEVKSAIQSFEKNRSQKCVEISKENARISGDGAVKVVISCNQYDEKGEPQANVYFITIRGNLYDSFFDLNSIAFVGAE